MNLRRQVVAAGLAGLGPEVVAVRCLVGRSFVVRLELVAAVLEHEAER